MPLAVYILQLLVDTHTHLLTLPRPFIEVPGLMLERAATALQCGRNMVSCCHHAHLVLARYVLQVDISRFTYVKFSD